MTASVLPAVSTSGLTNRHLLAAQPVRDLLTGRGHVHRVRDANALGSNAPRAGGADQCAKDERKGSGPDPPSNTTLCAP
jgi:hypothetical protein